MPQKNHYLPVFYQKRWAGTDGRVYSYSRPHKAGIVLRRHPSAVGYETDLYTVRGGDPVVASYLEQHFFKTTDDLGAEGACYYRARTMEPNGSAHSQQLDTVRHVPIASNSRRDTRHFRFGLKVRRDRKTDIRNPLRCY